MNSISDVAGEDARIVFLENSSVISAFSTNLNLNEDFHDEDINSGDIYGRSTIGGGLVQSPSPNGGALPEGWSEHSAEDGTPYFVNTATNETQWERPITTSITAPKPRYRIVSRPPLYANAEDVAISNKTITKYVRGKTAEDILDMLESGVIPDIDIRDADNDGYTCLLHQSGWGTTETVECLLVQEPPAQIDLQSRDYSGVRGDSRRDSPILLAVANNRVDILKVLLEYGAERGLPIGKANLTALEIARRQYRSHAECIKILESYYPECRSPAALKAKAMREEAARLAQEREEAEKRALAEAKLREIEKRKAEMRALEERMEADRRRAEERAAERRRETALLEAEARDKAERARLERERKEEEEAERARLAWEAKEADRRERERPFYCCLRLKRVYCG